MTREKALMLALKIVDICKTYGAEDRCRQCPFNAGGCFVTDGKNVPSDWRVSELIKSIETKAERKNIFVDAYELYEVDNSFHDAVICVANAFGKGIAEVLEQFNGCVNAFASAAKGAAESLELYAESFKNLKELEGVRPPSEIKKELKHEKNPMRIKQLNRELTESYKRYKRK